MSSTVTDISTWKQSTPVYQELWNEVAIPKADFATSRSVGHWVALSICIFSLVISFALAIWFGSYGRFWLTFASLGPLFASFMGILCVGARTK